MSGDPEFVKFPDMLRRFARFLGCASSGVLEQQIPA
jgi:hypothetical protein